MFTYYSWFIIYNMDLFLCQVAYERGLMGYFFFYI